MPRQQIEQLNGILGDKRGSTSLKLLSLFTPDSLTTLKMTAHHIAAMLVPSWGHTVSYLYIATQMLQKDPTLVISLVQHNMFGSLSLSWLMDGC
jgi:hypothetical protein